VICNAYKHGLKNWLGVKGVRRYAKNRSIQAVATLVTYEFVACSLVIVGYPFAWG
jgi:hypothetical protein